MRWEFPVLAEDRHIFDRRPKPREAIKNPDMIYLLTNVAIKTQDVPLDGTIFSGNTGQKDRATFVNKNIPIQLP